MSQKRRRVFRLEENEVAIVGFQEQWTHLIELFQILGERAEDNEKWYWKEAEDWVQFGLAQENGEMVDDIVSSD